MRGALARLTRPARVLSALGGGHHQGQQRYYHCHQLLFTVTTTDASSTTLQLQRKGLPGASTYRSLASKVYGLPMCLRCKGHGHRSPECMTVPRCELEGPR